MAIVGRHRGCLTTVVAWWSATFSRLVSPHPFSCFCLPRCVFLPASLLSPVGLTAKEPSSESVLQVAVALSSSLEVGLEMWQPQLAVDLGVCGVVWRCHLHEREIKQHYWGLAYVQGAALSSTTGAWRASGAHERLNGVVVRVLSVGFTTFWL
ncbi:hypothetical protein RHSIM_Rhsim06G0159800 [Rhododendron simsii]|uniref:Uncharacterized protein n=1 Tax=Rhododendron simsii TaxID=118357 RepID=A0A834GVY7_RHOSS|nr:hypothetical protein RHSIM_Rhsim06G0159800 [Rhododendron simsii]